MTSPHPFLRALSRVEKLQRDLAAARMTLRMEENKLSDAYGYKVPVRGHTLVTVLEYQGRKVA